MTAHTNVFEDTYNTSKIRIPTETEPEPLTESYEFDIDRGTHRVALLPLACQHCALMF